MTQRLYIPWINNDRRVRVAVVGDVILDEYLEGEVNRISPEAPVPVHLVTHSFHSAGGAANVARNIQLAGGEAILVSVWGDDEAARQLRRVLDHDHIDISHVVTVHDRPTIKKTRISASNQQLVRVDWEKVHPIEVAQQQSLLERLASLSCDVLLVSDYGKGCLPPDFLRRLMSLAKERGIPVVVDPKSKDFNRYRGAFLITPNRKEASEALGLDGSDPCPPPDMALRLQQTYGLENVLLTLGAKGMLLARQGGGTPLHLPAQAREVFDVSGAGDTVASVMALGIGAKAPLDLTMRLANLAAGRVVEKWGTQPVTLSELEAEVLERENAAAASAFSTEGKVVERAELQRMLEDHRRRGRRIVFTNGCFDILHAGHVSYLEQARALGDMLVVGLNTDESVTRLKGPTRPVNTCANRARLLAALSCVDYVVSFSEDTPAALITALLPDVLVKGADYSINEIVGAEVVLAAGGSIETVPLVAGLSTSAIVRRICDGTP